MANYELIDSILGALTDRIHVGNDYITETDLSGSLKVSRTRLRESIQTLDSFGIIAKRQKRGITLAKASPKKVREAYIINELLGRYITEEVVANCRDKDCDRLEEINQKFLDARSRRSYAEALRHDLEFHRTFVGIAKMEIVAQIINNLSLLKFAYMVPLNRDGCGDICDKLCCHYDIVDALRQRDQSCFRLVKKHIRDSQKILMRHCGEPENIII